MAGYWLAGEVTAWRAMQRTSRDPGDLLERLDAWLARQLPGRHATAVDVRVPDSNGMSNETILLDAAWLDDGGTPVEHRLVVRMAPDPGDVPVFPTYDLVSQHRAMRLVAARSTVPVPTARWLELDLGVLGAPFLVMDRIDGRVPPDVMPYTFEGWLRDATPAEQRTLQDACVAAIAGLHAIELYYDDLSWLTAANSSRSHDSPLRAHVEHWRDYYDWVRDGVAIPIIDAGFAWIESNWPAGDGGEPVFCWGDARIGNMMFDGFTPVAVLDWEMVGWGPRGLDLGWAVFLHTFFDDIANEFDLPGIPHMFGADDVRATYREVAGVDPGDLHWYETWAALRHGIVMARIHQRRLHFGEVAPVSDPDEAVMHRARLAQMIE